MVNEKLGAICNAHVVHADQSEHGALDKNCIRLAELAATTVDFLKTGKIVTMPQDLKPKVYPDFMGKDDFLSYKSDKILGWLYHLELPGSADFILDAWNKKCSYDGQLKALMAQYKVNGEEEVVTGHVWSMPKYNNRKQEDERNTLYEQKASAWYQVTYHPRWVMKSLELIEPETKEVENGTTATLLSFWWIPVEYLVKVKIK
ncbi:RNA-dependent RNA polymerase [Thalictrum thalictroides]|uniref:RNA-dependent RNA polymerase n=1 Tax=Thalictrum thalictroides TaxID=46969 RepID=A0A7J6VT93_THATH|nr:RNA-dependent RNA polymerase [Thalictrum thalictroides]